jgi:radical SAM superfamily enzyme YgiQ (UPF0313 family)
MRPRILLVNPPIYDFSAYDFWLRPYGMLRAAGFLREQANFQLFDFMDRLDRRVPPDHYRADAWGRGEFYSEMVEKPPIFSSLRRHYRRYGLPRIEFQRFVSRERHFDYALVQTGMTYWYPGVREVIEDLRALSPETKIILGGVYATLCPGHARTLGADLVVEGLDLNPLWQTLGLKPRTELLPLWDLYPRLKTGVLKLADGCPFRCTYCSVPLVHPKFHARPLEFSLAELEFLARCGVTQAVFYDDALLFQAERMLVPFLTEAVRKNINIEFHTPNALNARFIDRKIARLMINAGFKHIYLGFESSAYAWQKKTGGKVYSQELAAAVENLLAAGADARHLHAYIIVGHPNSAEQEVEGSMRFAHGLGIQVMLSEFSPIPGTPDGETCRGRVDWDEPLSHNKTYFTLLSLGDAEVSRLKTLAVALNHRLQVQKPSSIRQPIPTGTFS